MPSLLCLTGVGLLAAGAQPPGLLTHTIESPNQAGKTTVFVLLPDRLEQDRRYPVLYVLPVEAGTGSRYGNGLEEVKKLDLHNKHGLICVLPTFAHLPWYADHPTDPRIRQETYLLKDVLPLIEKEYPVLAEPRGRLLLGFSKSGWGAFSLLLRHPDVFGRAAAWDAPLNMAAPGDYGSGPIFGTKENFEHYRITALLAKLAGQPGKEARLGLIGYASFRAHHQAIHELMARHRIPHAHLDAARPQHSWGSGWLGAAVQFLTAPAE